MAQGYFYLIKTPNLNNDVEETFCGSHFRVQKKISMTLNIGLTTSIELFNHYRTWGSSFAQPNLCICYKLKIALETNFYLTFSLLSTDYDSRKCLWSSMFLG